MGYKKCTLSSDLLSYQFIAFTKNLFTVPKEGDILTVDNSDYSCDLYYQDEYHAKLVSEMKYAQAVGKFAASNNNVGWCTLMETIANAMDCSAPSQYHDYYTTSKMFLVDKNKEEKNSIEELRKNLDSYIVELDKMADDFQSIPRFSHLSTKIVKVALPMTQGLLEYKEQQRLREYLGEKIYGKYSFDGLAFYIYSLAEKSILIIKEFQQQVTADDEMYFWRVEDLLEALLHCLTEWEKIAPDVACADLTDKDGNTYSLGGQIPYEIKLLFRNIETPDTDKFRKIEKDIKNIEKHGGSWSEYSSGCLSMIIFLIGLPIVLFCLCIIN